MNQGVPPVKQREYGIFLPIGNGGWVMSTTAPHPQATYDYNRKAAVLAEQNDFDFIMSMAKWRGYGGTTDHWGQTLESITLMAALAEATTRVKIWATVHTNLIHPAVAAKMFTTLDQISNGRSGLNIVVGAYAKEFEQMGQWRSDFDHDTRYRYTEEWVEVIERLWAEDSVTHHGEFFTLDDCESRPHPAVHPTLISAGRSPRGLDFQSKRVDGSFLTAADMPGLRENSLEVKELAAAQGREIKTYSMLTVVMDETDARAEARFREYGRGVDTEAIVNMKLSWGLPLDKAMSMSADKPEFEAFQTAVVTGSPETVHERIDELMETSDIDGLMIVFPEYHDDLPPFGEQVMPKLRGERAGAGQVVAASTAGDDTTGLLASFDERMSL
ncbi:luciferase [Subtercola boreus]|uniref:Luciferase n=1 Tax=Subtercola boreus TaxID=120213 RepID=A0A3E0VRN6_9MICO|nr:luciferase [Subtercola boreus]